MTQKIIKGFPQYFSYTYLVGKYYGTSITQEQEFNDINLQSNLVGDLMTVDQEDKNLLMVIRDGAVLHEGQGYEIVGPNTVRVLPGLLDTETLEFKKFVGASGLVEIIPVVPPTVDDGGYENRMNEATFYTDNSLAPVNGFGAIVINNKTRLTTEFLLNQGRIDVYINGFRSSVNDGVWVLADDNTVELNDDYSSVKMKVDITKQRIG